MMGIGRSGEATPTGGPGGVDSVYPFSNSDTLDGSRTPSGSVSPMSSRFMHATSMDENDDFVPLDVHREGDPPSPLPENTPAIEIVMPGSPLDSPAETPKGEIRKTLIGSQSIRVGRDEGSRSPVLSPHACTSTHKTSSIITSTDRESAEKAPGPAWASAQPVQGLTSSMASIMSADSLGVGAPGISGSKNDSDNIHEDGKRSFSAAGSTGMKVLQPKAVTMRSSSTSPPDASLSDREEAPVTINATSGSSKPPLPLWAQARPTAAADASVTIAGIGVASSVQSAMSVDSLSEAKESRSKENLHQSLGNQ